MLTLSASVRQTYNHLKIMKTYSYFQSEIGFIGSEFMQHLLFAFMFIVCVGVPVYYCVLILLYELSK